MTDRPIIFSAPMVRALLDGRKTMTRRLAWRQVVTHPGCPPSWLDGLHCADGYTLLPSPWERVRPGDRLWVRERGHLLREAYEHEPGCGDLYRDAGFQYWADEAIVTARPYDAPLSEWIGDCARKSCPSIHMPRWASRLTLTVTATRIEPLRAISDEDALAEGVAKIAEHDYRVPGVEHPNRDFPYLARATPREMFAALWDTLHGSGHWLVNPEVIAITFEVAKINIDAKDAA